MTKTCATYDDVDLVFRLYELRREEKLREAREWFASSFITANVLYAELFFETASELFFVWERIKDIVPQFREGRQDPTLLWNLEKVAAQYAAWLEKNSA